MEKAHHLAHGTYHTVGHDGDDDHPFEGGPCDEPNKKSPGRQKLENQTKSHLEEKIRKHPHETIPSFSFRPLVLDISRFLAANKIGIKIKIRHDR